MIDRRSQELGSLGAPVLIDLLDVRDADVQEAAHRVGIGCGQRHSGLVVGRAAPFVDDDPAVRQRDDRRALGDALAAEDVRVEVSRAGDVLGDDEVGEQDACLGGREWCHLGSLLIVEGSATRDHAGFFQLMKRWIASLAWSWNARFARSGKISDWSTMGPFSLLAVLA